MTGTPFHDWLRPRLEDLVTEAEAHGIERTIAVAVLTDLITGPDFNPTPLPTDIDS